MGEPWSFDRHLVILTRFDGKSSTEELDYVTSFWVQIHNLPLSMMTPEVAMDIGETLGVITRMVDKSEMVGGNFMRVRVSINITQPLCRGCYVSFE
ncbi:hypothetical protein SO802_017710 [Lithocarpus litseifolius]|uniref:DUF4283 domain-containing protein n=1 Tax=Lithocarpus litseifolius TaxID=425828 RepID=A0AAW2CKP7_9ROSI